ncbi:uncharacterized protein [Drosophila takahashii]|uniref:uncharacterized protein n=1 Tax=Drosophila takahashii TaxID=29030 RepID=UPI001CF8A8D7|nr:uncharacterized protein LOC108059660 [Drosophila takahashii]
MNNRQSYQGRPLSSQSTDFLFYLPGALRPVLFLFYTLETMCNITCLAYHISGFQTVNLETFGLGGRIHDLYLGTFYLFLVLTSFQSVAICTGHTPNVLVEIYKASAAAVAFILISLTTLWNAERQSHLFVGAIDRERYSIHSVYNEDPPSHPIFKFMRGQSISSLCCGLIYMLHAAIMIDVKLTSRFNDRGKHAPIPLFVLGRAVHSRLNRYAWFQEFCENDSIDI